MPLRTITTVKSEIVCNDSLRFDANYYLVNAIFKALEKKSSCKVKTLKELNAKISSGSYIDTYLTKTTGVPYIRVGNIKPFSIDESERSLVYVSKNVPNKIKVKENDIVIGRTQATVEKLGVASIIDKTNEDFIISQHISKITADKTIISPFYLIGYFNSKFYKAQTALATHGDTRVEMTHSQLKNIKVFLPEDKVIKIIDAKIRIVIENNMLAVEKIKTAKDLLNNNLNIESNNTDKFFSVTLKTIQDFGLWNASAYLPKYIEQENNLTNNFKTVKLGKISIIKKGVEPGSSTYKTELFKNESDYAFIRTSDITNNEIDIFPDYFISSDFGDTVNTIDAGGIVFSKDGAIGETAIISKHDKIIIASGFAQIQLNKDAKKYNITPEYLFAVLSSEETGFYPAKRRTVTASTLPHLRESRLKEIEIPVLDKDSIDEISILIKEAFALKDKKKKLIKEIKNEIDNYFDI
jgi:type I restriction enzyme S subunit